MLNFSQHQELSEGLHLLNEVVPVDPVVVCADDVLPVLGKARGEIRSRPGDEIIVGAERHGASTAASNTTGTGLLANGNLLHDGTNFQLQKQNITNVVIIYFLFNFPCNLYFPSFLCSTTLSKLFTLPKLDT